MKYESRYEVLSIKRAGQKGTKRWLAKFGDRLRNVRYLRDKLTGEHFKTVEIVVEKSPWFGGGLNPDLVIGVKVGLHEKELRAKVKEVGGAWDHFDRVWLIKYKYLRPLGLDNREFIVREEQADYQVH